MGQSSFSSTAHLDGKNRLVSHLIKRETVNVKQTANEKNVCLLELLSQDKVSCDLIYMCMCASADL